MLNKAAHSTRSIPVYSQQRCRVEKESAKAIRKSETLYAQLKSSALEGLRHKEAEVPSCAEVSLPSTEREKVSELEDKLKLHTACVTLETDDVSMGAAPERQRRVTEQIVADALQQLKESERVAYKKVMFAGREFLLQVDAEGRELKRTAMKNIGDFDELKKQLEKAEQVSAITKSRADWISSEDAKKASQDVHTAYKGAATDAIQRQKFLSKIAEQETAAAKRMKRGR